MGAPRLSTFVHVVEMTTDKGGKPVQGRSGMFGPTDSLPDWAVSSINNPDVWAGDPPARSEPAPLATSVPEDPGAELARLEGRIAELKATEFLALPQTFVAGVLPPEKGSDQDGPPPKGGAGSGAPAWREYAAKRQVEVAEDASREDVWAALEAAGVRTE